MLNHVGRIIRVTRNGVYSGFSDDVISFEFLSHLRRARTILIEADTTQLSVPALFRLPLLNAIRSVPVYFDTITKKISPFIAQIMSEATIFDRVLVDKSDNLRSDIGLSCTIECDRNANLEDVIVNDLSIDEGTAGSEIEPNHDGPMKHWNSRAATFGGLGRTVCYLNAARHINKLMHSVQVAELGEALKRAQRTTENPDGKITLLDYGCGIGRLSRLASKFGSYNGIDFAPSMVKVARQINPSANFFTIEEADNGVLPLCDTVMAVTVVQHNDKPNRREIFSRISRLSGVRFRLILLEDLVATDRIDAVNMHHFSIDDLMDDIVSQIGGTTTLESFRLLSYKPADLVRRTGLLELEIRRQ